MSDNYFLLALAFGPQLGSGFSGNRANFKTFESGKASLLILNDAFNLDRIIIIITIILFVHAYASTTTLTLFLVEVFFLLVNYFLNFSQDFV